MIVQSRTVGPLGTNCYLCGEEKQGLCVLIDPGAEAPVLLDMIRRSGLRPVAILLTHGHFDHFTAVPEVQAAYPDLPVYLHPADYCGDEAAAQARYACPPMARMRFYQEGDTIPLGEQEIRVWETPGHTGGSVTLQVGNILFTGDTLFSGACGRTDLPRGNTEQMYASLKKLGSLPGDYTVYPGHGESTSLETERAANPYLCYAMKR